MRINPPGRRGARLKRPSVTDPNLSTAHGFVTIGLAVAGVREDAERTRMLGYNVDFIQVQVFTLAAGLAGLSGVLYVSWGNYMNPSSMGMVAATLPVIWTAVGGRNSLLAVLLSTVALRWLADALAVRGGEYAFLILGSLLLSTMLFSAASTVAILVPVGVALNMPTALLIAFYPAANAVFFLPTYGTVLAAVSFDQTGTTKIGKYVLNHSFMLPGIVTTLASVIAGLLLQLVLL